MKDFTVIYNERVLAEGHRLVADIGLVIVECEDNTDALSTCLKAHGVNIDDVRYILEGSAQIRSIFSFKSL